MGKTHIIQISGKQGSGKSTLSEGLAAHFTSKGMYAFRRRYAGPLYEMHDQVLMVLEKYGVERQSPDKRLLQLLGTEWGREHVSQTLWVDLMRNEVARISGFMLDKDRDAVVIIEDCRFKNEFNAFPESFRIRLECSEIFRKKRTHCWRDQSGHPSEIDLDEWADQFSLTMNTDVMTKDQTLDLAVTAFKLRNPGLAHAAG